MIEHGKNSRQRYAPPKITLLREGRSCRAVVYCTGNPEQTRARCTVHFGLSAQSFTNSTSH